MHESEMPERDEREVPGDADDSMEWLEELAADTGALWEDPPLEEPISSAEPAEESGGDASAEWLAAHSEAAEPKSEPIPEWLIPHLETGELPVGDETNEPTEIAMEQDTMVSAKIPSIPDDDGDASEGNSEEESTEDLSWLDRIASGEGTAIEETPTMRWEESDVESNEEESAQHETPSAGEEIEVPEDADEAMAWLEQLATRQGAPSEEMTMPEAETDVEIPEFEDEPEAVNVTAIPEDPDEAVAWLEQLAAQQGAPDEELTSFQEEVYDLVEETAPSVDDQLESAVEELDGVVMPEDSDEALAWLGELAGVEIADSEPEAVSLEAEVIEEPPTPAVEHDIVAARAEAEILFGQQESFEVVDEASALEAETAIGEDLEADSDDLETDEETIVDVVDQPYGGDVVEAEGAVDELDDASLDEGEGQGDLMATADVAGGDMAAQADEDLDWLDSLDEKDAVSWLESESAASQAETIEDEGRAEAIVVEPEGDVEVAEPVADTVAATREPALDVSEEVPLDGAGALDIARLESAKSAIEAEDWAAVASEYEALLESGEGLPSVIADLEKSVEVHEQQPILKRLLGDAYVRSGQLERAVDIYRQALDQL